MFRFVRSRKLFEGLAMVVLALVLANSADAGKWVVNDYQGGSDPAYEYFVWIRQNGVPVNVYPGDQYTYYGYADWWDIYLWTIDIQFEGNAGDTITAEVLRRPITSPPTTVYTKIADAVPTYVP